MPCSSIPIPIPIDMHSCAHPPARSSPLAHALLVCQPPACFSLSPVHLFLALPRPPASTPPSTPHLPAPGPPLCRPSAPPLSTSLSLTPLLGLSPRMSSLGSPLLGLFACHMAASHTPSACPLHPPDGLSSTPPKLTALLLVAFPTFRPSLACPQPHALP